MIAFVALGAMARSAGAQEPAPDTTLGPEPPPPPGAEAFPPSSASSPPANTATAPAASAPPSTPERTRWYGWQTLTVDGATIALASGLGSTHSGEASGVAFVGGYLLGGPVVHWAHGNVGTGFGSLGLRAAAPLVLGLTGALIGSGYSSNNEDFGSAGVGAVIGVFAGYATAVAVDAAVLSREKVSEPVAEAKQSVRIAPTVSLRSTHDAVAGLTGTF